MHPSFEELEAYAATGEPQALQDHIEGCDQCGAMVEGLRNITALAQEANQSPAQLIAESEVRVKPKVTTEVSEPKPVIPMWRWVAAAAAVVLIATITFLSPTTNRLDRFIDDQLNTPIAPPVQVRSTEGLDRSWSLFRQQYADADYDGALETLSTLPPSQLNAEMKFYKAITLMYASSPDFSGANDVLNELITSNSRFKERSQWFQSICYIKLNQPDNAKRILSEIEKTNGFKAEEAGELLRLLR